VRDALENRTIPRILATWPLVVHFILTIVVATVMFTNVNNHYFGITTRRPDVPQVNGSVTHWHYILLQTDVTTAVSFSQTAMRAMGTLWTVPMAWRCIYILLELEGISLAEINRILTWSLPITKIGGRSMFAIILLAAFPAQFSSPILTGSITWKSSELLVNGDTPINGISISTEGIDWVQYQRYGWVIADTIVQRANAIADVAWGGKIQDDASTTTTMTLPKRVLPTTQYLPVGSMLANTTTPYFIIDTFDWVRDPQVSYSLYQRTWSLPDILDQASPFRNAEGPFVSLIPNTSWTPSPHPFPQPTIVSETRNLMILVDRTYNTTNTTGCRSRTTKYLGYIPQEIILEPMYQADNDIRVTNCYAFATVRYRAGVVPCHNCRLFAWTLLGMASDAIVPELEPDVMTIDALSLAPKVTQSMVLGNYSTPNPYNNANNFVREMLARSYQASWNALTDKFESSSMSVATSIMVPIQLSQAHVASWRIYIWVGLNLMLTLSGFLFWVVQRRCKKPMVINVGVAALLLNPVEVLNIARSQELDDLSVLLDGDSEVVGPIKLEMSQNGHRILVARDHK